MKKFLVALNIVIWSFLGYQVTAHATESKEVCHEETDKKGNKKEVCKNVKVHKKLEGTAVPDKKKK